MANMLYNGVELPDIDTVWTDKETYPYAYIGYSPSLNVYTLMCSSNPAFYKMRTTTIGGDWFVNGTLYASGLGNSTAGWVVSSQGVVSNTTDSYDSKNFEAGYQIIWANYDVYRWTDDNLAENDGSLYLAASDPVPVGGSSHVTESSGDGYALYNGVKLPNIDSVWTDKTKYPYAFLVSDSVNFGLFLVDIPVELTDANEKAVTPSTDGKATVYLLEGGVFNLWIEDYSVGPGWGAVGVFWTSNNITNPADDSIWLASSSPIPLDGMTVIEWDGDTTGLTDIAVPDATVYRVSDAYIDLSSEQDFEIVFRFPTGELATKAELAGSTFHSGNDADAKYWYFGGDNALAGSVARTDDPEGSGFGLGVLIDGLSYTQLFAYTPASTEPEEPEDTTKKDFWNGVACGLCGSGTPNFSDTSPFGVGYITGCKLRALRERKPIAYLYGTPSDSGNIGLRSGDTVTLYDGAVLPPLPEWDKETYPYAVIQYTTIIPESPKYRLLCSASPTVLMTGILGGSTPAPCLIWTAGDTWVGGYINEDGQTWVNCTPIWTNYDLYYRGSETPALAASDPVPVYAEPVAYLYNGVELPALPEWNKEAYPYAVIARIGVASSSYKYTLRLFSNAYTTSGTSVLYSFYEMTADIGKTWLACSCPYIDLGDGTFVWGEISEHQIVDADADGISDAVLVGMPIWSDFDLTANGGTVWLEASDPVPVYENEDIVDGLISSDGYVLQDVNGMTLTPKESE